MNKLSKTIRLARHHQHRKAFSYVEVLLTCVVISILLVSALVILLSRSAVGSFVLPQLYDVADWIRNYPSMSARRAILIGIGLGSLTTSLRVILGIDRTWLGGGK